MCILDVCENPTEPGVWWRDDTKWCLYSAQHQALIKKGIAGHLEEIDLGTIVSVIHPSGANYTLDLLTNEQVAVSSWQRRPVMVVAAPTIKKNLRLVPILVRKTVLPRSPKDLPLNGLHYKTNDGNLQRYDSYVEQAILQSMRAGIERDA